MLTFFETIFDFGPTTGRESTFRRDVEIPRANPGSNSRVALALRSFDFKFTNADHHLLRLVVRPEVDGIGPFTNTVPIRLNVGMRDSTGQWDDSYEGRVRLGIIVIDDDRVDLFDRSQDFAFQTGLGPQSETSFLQLNDASQTGVSFLRGFDIGYERDDRPVLEIVGDIEDQMIDVSGTMHDAVRCQVGLRDNSGFWDDPYGGSLFFSSLRFPIDTYGVEDGTINVTGVNDGPARGTADHFIQQAIPEERLFVGLTGFQSRYTGGDHHVHRLISRVGIDEVDSDGARTTIRVEYRGGIRDRTGEWDDAFASSGKYALLAVTDEALAVRLRVPPGNLLVPIPGRRLSKGRLGRRVRRFSPPGK